VRALGAKVINGTACLDIPVGEEFRGADTIASRPTHELRRESAAQVHN